MGEQTTVTPTTTGPLSTTSAVSMSSHQGNSSAMLTPDSAVNTGTPEPTSSMLQSTTPPGINTAQKKTTITQASSTFIKTPMDEGSTLMTAESTANLDSTTTITTSIAASDMTSGDFFTTETIIIIASAGMTGLGLLILVITAVTLRRSKLLKKKRRGESTSTHPFTLANGGIPEARAGESQNFSFFFCLPEHLRFSVTMHMLALHRAKRWKPLTAI